MDVRVARVEGDAARLVVGGEAHHLDDAGVGVGQRHLVDGRVTVAGPVKCVVAAVVGQALHHALLFGQHLK